jgi:hypothetical protein
MIVHTTKVTRSRSISLIFPAATRRSSALALNLEMLSLSHSAPAYLLVPFEGSASPGTLGLFISRSLALVAMKLAIC